MTDPVTAAFAGDGAQGTTSQNVPPAEQKISPAETGSELPVGNPADQHSPNQDQSKSPTSSTETVTRHAGPPEVKLEDFQDGSDKKETAAQKETPNDGNNDGDTTKEKSSEETKKEEEQAKTTEEQKADNAGEESKTREGRVRQLLGEQKKELMNLANTLAMSENPLQALLGFIKGSEQWSKYWGEKSKTPIADLEKRLGENQTLNDIGKEVSAIGAMLGMDAEGKGGETDPRLQALDIAREMTSDVNMALLKSSAIDTGKNLNLSQQETDKLFSYAQSLIKSDPTLDEGKAIEMASFRLNGVTGSKPKAPPAPPKVPGTPKVDPNGKPPNTGNRPYANVPDSQLTSEQYAEKHGLY